MNKRNAFLVHMYDQLFNDINRHIMVVWQSVSVVIGAFAIFALVETKFLPIDIAIGLIVLLCGWLLAHSEDASYWYNRNLAMIANIERQFLKQEDLKKIHYYFGEHRGDNEMIGHLKIQYVFGLSVATLVILYHFFVQVMPGFSSTIEHFEPIRTIPYLFSVLAAWFVRQRRNKGKRKYKEFLENSPGIDIDTTGINYGEGHGKE